MKIKPIEVVRDECGFFIHPEYSKLLDELLGDREYPTIEEWESFKNELGIKISNVYLENDASKEIVDSYFDGNIDSCKDWIPTKPKGDDDWNILSIHDTEDGAVCLWFAKA